MWVSAKIIIAGVLLKDFTTVYNGRCIWWHMNIVIGGWESVKSLDKIRGMLTLVVMKLAHWYQRLLFHHLNILPKLGDVEGATISLLDTPMFLLLKPVQQMDPNPQFLPRQ
jgi:hypothetical protein